MYIILDIIFYIYMYIKYNLYMPLLNHFLFPNPSPNVSERFLFPDGTPAFSYFFNSVEYISLEPPVYPDSDESSPIATVIVKANDAEPNDTLIQNIIKLGGHRGDFGGRKYTLHEILTRFKVKRNIKRIIATNENYEEYIFKTKED